MFRVHAELIHRPNTPYVTLPHNLETFFEMFRSFLWMGQNQLKWPLAGLSIWWEQSVLLKMPRTAEEISREQRPYVVRLGSIFTPHSITNTSILNGAVRCRNPSGGCQRPFRAPSTYDVGGISWQDTKEKSSIRIWYSGKNPANCTMTIFWKIFIR